jgi:outer membrane protein assembly factor BamB
MGGVNSPGTYTGNVRLSVCTEVCNGFNGVTGSPVQIPYTVVVAPPVMLQPVLTPSGLPEWETYQGNAAHTGFVPVTLNAGIFSARWSRDYGVPLSPATVANGKVFVSTPVYFSFATLYALSEVDGSQVWAHSFGSVPALNPPAAYGGRVFIATSGHSDTFMWSFNADDGVQVFKTPFSAQWEHYLAPTLLDGEACFSGGYYGDIYCLYASTGASKWSVVLGQYDQWTPALDHTYAFTYTGSVYYGANGTFRAINRYNGTEAFTVSDPAFNWNGYSINAAPVIATNDSVLVVNGTGKANHVIRYSISGRSESWRVSGTFLNDPVAAAGKLYLSNETGNRLEARDEPTGTLQWTWQPPSGETMSRNNLILANNIVFVGTSDATYAVDLTTRQTVWRVARPGTLTLSSNRVLYIVSPAGRVDAFNLF